MKINKTILSLLFMICIGYSAIAENYEPTTNWPYQYHNFEDGTIFFKNGKKLDMKLNIHLLRSNLHYLKDEVIHVADVSNPIDSVIIRGEKYIFNEGKIVRLFYKTANDNKLIYYQMGDFEALHTAEGAYGTAAHTSSTKDLSTFEIGGITNRDHRVLTLQKEDWRILPLEQKHLFIINGKEVEASKGDIKKILTKEQYKDFKKFLKKEKIKWNKVNDLIKVLDYLSK